jgi:acyl-CoA thioester hydrolase
MKMSISSGECVDVLNKQLFHFKYCSFSLYSFFKEIYHGQEVFVSLEINGVSEDGGIYQFQHKFYLEDGTHCATAEALGVWIDTKIRKSTLPPIEIMAIMRDFKSENCITLTKETIKNLPFRQENMDPSQLK